MKLGLKKLMWAAAITITAVVGFFGAGIIKNLGFNKEDKPLYDIGIEYKDGWYLIDSAEDYYIMCANASVGATPGAQYKQVCDITIDPRRAQMDVCRDITFSGGGYELNMAYDPDYEEDVLGGGLQVTGSGEWVTDANGVVYGRGKIVYDDWRLRVERNGSRIYLYDQERESEATYYDDGIYGNQRWVNFGDPFNTEGGMPEYSIVPYSLTGLFKDSNNEHPFEYPEKPEDQAFSDDGYERVLGDSLMSNNSATGGFSPADGGYINVDYNANGCPRGRRFTIGELYDNELPTWVDHGLGEEFDKVIDIDVNELAFESGVYGVDYPGFACAIGGLFGAVYNCSISDIYLTYESSVVINSLRESTVYEVYCGALMFGGVVGFAQKSTIQKCVVEIAENVTFSKEGNWNDAYSVFGGIVGAICDGTTVTECFLNGGNANKYEVVGDAKVGVVRNNTKREIEWNSNKVYGLDDGDYSAWMMNNLEKYICHYGLLSEWYDPNYSSPIYNNTTTLSDLEKQFGWCSGPNGYVGNGIRINKCSICEAYLNAHVEKDAAGDIIYDEDGKATYDIFNIVDPTDVNYTPTTSRMLGNSKKMVSTGWVINNKINGGEIIQSCFVKNMPPADVTVTFVNNAPNRYMGTKEKPYYTGEEIKRSVSKGSYTDQVYCYTNENANVGYHDDVFLGWAEDKDPTKVVWPINESTHVIAGDTTFYPVWETRCYAEFLTNDGSGNTTDLATFGKAYYVSPKGEPEEMYYWDDNDALDEKYLIYNFDGYPGFDPGYLTRLHNSTDGIVYRLKPNLGFHTPMISRPGYIFRGWKKGTTTVEDHTLETITANTTYYAQWEKQETYYKVYIHLYTTADKVAFSGGTGWKVQELTNNTKGYDVLELDGYKKGTITLPTITYKGDALKYMGFKSHVEGTTPIDAKNGVYIESALSNQQWLTAKWLEGMSITCTHDGKTKEGHLERHYDIGVVWNSTSEIYIRPTGDDQGVWPAGISVDKSESFARSDWELKSTTRFGPEDRVTLPTLSRPGYRFIGYYETNKIDGSDQYSSVNEYNYKNASAPAYINGGTYIQGKGVNPKVLYAIWERNSVEFDANAKADAYKNYTVGFDYSNLNNWSLYSGGLNYITTSENTITVTPHKRSNEIIGLPLQFKSGYTYSITIKGAWQDCGDVGGATRVERYDLKEPRDIVVPDAYQGVGNEPRVQILSQISHGKDEKGQNDNYKFEVNGFGYDLIAGGSNPQTSQQGDNLTFSFTSSFTAPSNSNKVYYLVINFSNIEGNTRTYRIDQVAITTGSGTSVLTGSFEASKTSGNRVTVNSSSNNATISLTPKKANGEWEMIQSKLSVTPGKNYTISFNTQMGLEHDGNADINIARVFVVKNTFSYTNITSEAFIQNHALTLSLAGGTNNSALSENGKYVKLKSGTSNIGIDFTAPGSSDYVYLIISFGHMSESGWIDLKISNFNVQPKRGGYISYTVWESGSGRETIDIRNGTSVSIEAHTTETTLDYEKAYMKISVKPGKTYQWKFTADIAALEGDELGPVPSQIKMRVANRGEGNIAGSYTLDEWMFATEFDETFTVPMGVDYVYLVFDFSTVGSTVHEEYVGDHDFTINVSEMSVMEYESPLCQKVTRATTTEDEIPKIVEPYIYASDMKTFSHWNEKTDDTGTSYTYGDEFKGADGEAVLTLYAIYTQDVVVFNAYGAENGRHGGGFESNNSWVQDMTHWHLYQFAARFDISYSNGVSTVKLDPTKGWEIMGIPLNMEAGTEYDITFDYNTKHTGAPLCAVITKQVVAGVNNVGTETYGLENDKKNITIKFTPTETRIYYFILNFGYVGDGQAFEATFKNFNFGGATVASLTAPAASNKRITAFPDDPVLEGSGFYGWNSAPDGSGEEIVNGSFIPSDRTVYAVWGPARKCIILDLKIDGANIEGTEIFNYDPKQNSGVKYSYYENDNGVHKIWIAKIQDTNGQDTANWEPVALPTKDQIYLPGYTFTGWTRHNSLDGITLPSGVDSGSLANNVAYDTKENYAIAVAAQTGGSYIGYLTVAAKLREYTITLSFEAGVSAGVDPQKYTGIAPTFNNPVITYTIENEFRLPMAEIDGQTTGEITGGKDSKKYKFLGWQVLSDDGGNDKFALATYDEYDGEYITGVQEGLAGNYTLVAVWKPITYRIYLNLDAGTLSSCPGSITGYEDYVSSEVTASAPYLKYSATGASPVIYYTAEDVFHLPYNTSEKSIWNFGNTVVLEKLGYDFIGWIVDTSAGEGYSQDIGGFETEIKDENPYLVKSKEGLTGNYKLIAIWKPKPYTITLDLQYSDDGNAESVDVGGHGVKDYYPTGVTASYAEKKITISYTIESIFNLPTDSEVSKYAYEFIEWVWVKGECEPDREQDWNSKLTDWFGNTGTPVTSIPEGVFGNHTLKAVWKPIDYTIRLHSNKSGEGAGTTFKSLGIADKTEDERKAYLTTLLIPDAQNCITGKSNDMPYVSKAQYNGNKTDLLINITFTVEHSFTINGLTRPLYNFAGWYTTNDCTTTTLTNTDTTTYMINFYKDDNSGAITGLNYESYTKGGTVFYLYAKWEAKIYTVKLDLGDAQAFVDDDLFGSMTEYNGQNKSWYIYDTTSYFGDRKDLGAYFDNGYSTIYINYTINSMFYLPDVQHIFKAGHTLTKWNVSGVSYDGDEAYIADDNKWDWEYIEETNKWMGESFDPGAYISKKCGNVSLSANFEENSYSIVLDGNNGERKTYNLGKVGFEESVTFSYEPDDLGGYAQNGYIVCDNKVFVGWSYEVLDTLPYQTILDTKTESIYGFDSMTINYLKKKHEVFTVLTPSNIDALEANFRGGILVDGGNGATVSKLIHGSYDSFGAISGDSTVTLYGVWLPIYNVDIKKGDGEVNGAIYENGHLNEELTAAGHFSLTNNFYEGYNIYTQLETELFASKFEASTSGIRLFKDGYEIIGWKISVTEGYSYTNGQASAITSKTNMYLSIPENFSSAEAAGSPLNWKMGNGTVSSGVNLQYLQGNITLTPIWRVLKIDVRFNIAQNEGYKEAYKDANTDVEKVTSIDYGATYVMAGDYATLTNIAPIDIDGYSLIYFHPYDSDGNLLPTEYAIAGTWDYQLDYSSYENSRLTPSSDEVKWYVKIEGYYAPNLYRVELNLNLPYDTKATINPGDFEDATSQQIDSLADVYMAKSIDGASLDVKEDETYKNYITGNGRKLYSSGGKYYIYLLQDHVVAYNDDEKISKIYDPYYNGKENANKVYYTLPSFEIDYYTMQYYYIVDNNNTPNVEMYRMAETDNEHLELAKQTITGLYGTCDIKGLESTMQWKYTKSNYGNQVALNSYWYRNILNLDVNNWLEENSTRVNTSNGYVVIEEIEKITGDPTNYHVVSYNENNERVVYSFTSADEYWSSFVTKLGQNADDAFLELLSYTTLLFGSNQPQPAYIPIKFGNEFNVYAIDQSKDWSWTESSSICMIGYRLKNIKSSVTDKEFNAKDITFAISGYESNINLKNYEEGVADPFINDKDILKIDLIFEKINYTITYQVVEDTDMDGYVPTTAHGKIHLTSNGLTESGEKIEKTVTINTELNAAMYLNLGSEFLRWMYCESAGGGNELVCDSSDPTQLAAQATTTLLNAQFLRYYVYKAASEPYGTEDRVFNINAICKYIDFDVQVTVKDQKTESILDNYILKFDTENPVFTINGANLVGDNKLAISKGTYTLDMLDKGEDKSFLYYNKDGVDYALRLMYILPTNGNVNQFVNEFEYPLESLDGRELDLTGEMLSKIIKYVQFVEVKQENRVISFYVEVAPLVNVIFTADEDPTDPHKGLREILVRDYKSNAEMQSVMTAVDGDGLTSATYLGYWNQTLFITFKGSTKYYSKAVITDVDISGKASDEVVSKEISPNGNIEHGFNSSFADASANEIKIKVRLLPKVFELNGYVEYKNGDNWDPYSFQELANLVNASGTQIVSEVTIESKGGPNYAYYDYIVVNYLLALPSEYTVEVLAQTDNNTYSLMYETKELDGRTYSGYITRFVDSNITIIVRVSPASEDVSLTANLFENEKLSQAKESFGDIQLQVNNGATTAWNKSQEGYSTSLKLETGDKLHVYVKEAVGYVLDVEKTKELSDRTNITRDLIPTGTFAGYTKLTIYSAGYRVDGSDPSGQNVKLVFKRIPIKVTFEYWLIDAGKVKKVERSQVGDGTYIVNTNAAEAAVYKDSVLTFGTRRDNSGYRFTTYTYKANQWAAGKAIELEADTEQFTITGELLTHIVENEYKLVVYVNYVQQYKYEIKCGKDVVVMVEDESGNEMHQNIYYDNGTKIKVTAKAIDSKHYMLTGKLQTRGTDETQDISGETIERTNKNNVSGLTTKVELDNNYILEFATEAESYETEVFIKLKTDDEAHKDADISSGVSYEVKGSNKYGEKMQIQIKVENIGDVDKQYYSLDKIDLNGEEISLAGLPRVNDGTNTTYTFEYVLEGDIPTEQKIEIYLSALYFVKVQISLG